MTPNQAVEGTLASARVPHLERSAYRRPFVKTTSILLTTLLFIASVTASSAATKGFSGILVVHSVSVADSKAVLVVSGSCELLLAAPPASSGAAQEVVSAVDHAVIVRYRTGREFPTEEAWQKECARFTSLAGKRVRFHTAVPDYTWKSGDLTLISTDQLSFEVEKANTNK